MAVIQLTGGSVAAPEGALNIRLSRAQGVELILLDAEGEIVAPNFQVTPAEVVIVPSGPFTVSARTTNGAPFASGVRMGVTIKSAAGSGDEVVRPPAEVGGRQAVSLVEVVGGEIVDLLGEASRAEQGWMQRGNYAYHVNHRQGTGRTTRWACVLDGSAMSHHETDAEGYRGFLELVLGVASTAFGGQPEAWVVASRPMRDITSALAGDEIDWSGAVHDPAPWPGFLPAVQQVSSRLPKDAAVVLVVDGVPVDYREVRELLAEAGQECIVVALGRSRRGARPEDRPSQFWEEELAALDDFERVVSVASLAGLQEQASQLADAMFPGGGQ